MNKIKKLMMICIFLIFSLTLVGCGTNPETVVENYFNTLKSKGFIEASNFTDDKLTEEDSKDFNYTLMDKKIQTALSSKIEYKILESHTSFTNARVKVKINYIDLLPIIDRLPNDIIPIAIKGLLEGKIENLEDCKDIEMTYICDSIKDKNAETAMLVLDINLKRSFKNHWAIATNDEFFKASLGNAREAGEKLEKLNDKYANMSKEDQLKLIENYLASLSPEKVNKFFKETLKNVPAENIVKLLRPYIDFLSSDGYKNYCKIILGESIDEEQLNIIQQKLKNISDEDLKVMIEEVLSSL
ncbi:putative lipoprotein [Clostridium argentinense CDC 2741]|uniref:Putative lipoprotein n=1 Tax=Clostridium argentinense CDC 2741 TaxID=1418104 RepID=A0A0C1QVK8_9CLOT|nr:hypothetical protein [Clostridium argentinense]ARC84379.1 hypothetical protein RSJ17_07450 [Clostridium argentinense]KIE45002.1 putative lipoprotein [Clostridium argentinense CDC 2741]NFF38350.1 hypothetical protein [Clostridium argentinense]NFP49066.1 hypothetical protein [Clostridium argentinense]NFP71654.1 hypothetical protein [Clostridium argentinense]